MLDVSVGDISKNLHRDKFDNEEDGVKCESDHSRMVCKSGVAYCGAAKFTSSPKEAVNNDESLLLLQDIPVNRDSGKVKSISRVLWDTGSSKALITHKITKKLKLKGIDVKFKLCVVVGKHTAEKAKMCCLNLIDNIGNKHQILGYGIDNIMEPPDPVDPSPLHSLFRHLVPSSFGALPKKEIDNLVGVNRFSIHPAGGFGRDCARNIKVLHSLFSSSCVNRGSHPRLEITTPKFFDTKFIRCAKVQVRPVISFEDVKCNGDLQNNVIIKQDIHEDVTHEVAQEVDR